METHMEFLSLSFPPRSISPKIITIHFFSFFFPMNPFLSSSSLSSDPLFSSIVALYILIFLYSPHIPLRILSSPVLISTAVLLLSLLRLGASQKSQENPNHIPFKDEIGTQDQSQFHLDSPSGKSQNSEFGSGSGSFVQWDVSAPLEVIYEAAYEGEEEEDEMEERSLLQCIERYPILSKYYPETDSGSDDDDDDDDGVEDEGEWEIPVIGGWESPERECFRWVDHDEERDDGLIEIALDGSLRKVADNEEFIEIDFLRREIPTESVFSGE